MDFNVFLGVHNILRWLVLAFGVAALIASYSGLFSKRSWQSADKIMGLAFNIFFGLQLILGLVLYGISPLIRPLMSDPSLIARATGSSKAEMFFFFIYHIVVMIIAFILAQIGYSRSKRAESDRVKFRLAATFYTLAILLIFLAIPWGIRPNWPNYLFG